MTDEAAAEGTGRAERRRRRRRPGRTSAASPSSPDAPGPASEAGPARQTEAAAGDGAAQPAPPAPRGAGRRRSTPREADRGLRELVGGGSSQLGVSGALRGRDANRPTPEDLAEAEASVVIVRRHWTPDESQR